MSTVLPREEAVETIFSKILASPEASGRLSGVFYDHIDDDHRLTDNDRDHFLQVLFHAYQNGDISALLLELCGRSMFDLLREAYLIPKKFHGKAGENPVLLTDAAGELLPPGKRFQPENMQNSRKHMNIMNVPPDLRCILQMVMILSVPIQKV